MTVNVAPTGLKMQNKTMFEVISKAVNYLKIIF